MVDTDFSDSDVEAMEKFLQQNPTHPLALSKITVIETSLCIEIQLTLMHFLARTEDVRVIQTKTFRRKRFLVTKRSTNLILTK